MISKNRIKDIRALKQKKLRDQKKMFLIEGVRLCLEALQADFIVETILVSDENISSPQSKQILDLAHQKNVEIIEIEKAEVAKLAETVHSQGIFGIVEQRPYSLDKVLNKSNRLILIIDSGQDPGNVGTIIRTCDWFKIDAVLMSSGSVELFNPKVVRSTMGSIFHLPICENVELHEALPRLKQLNYQIYAADVRGAFFFHEIEYQFPAALIIGNENRGLDSRLFAHIDKTVAIPSFGKAESLNMATAAAIIMSRMIC
jgi:TrmH family RNA methyltransferase